MQQGFYISGLTGHLYKEGVTHFVCVFFAGKTGTMHHEKPVILFDNACALCHRGVHFIIRHTHEGRFRFVPLKSSEGKRWLKISGLPEDYTASLVLVLEGNVFVKSDAVLRIAGKLQGLWPLFSIFRIVPRGFRDLFYDFIARYREKWFGGRGVCEIHPKCIS